MFIFTTESGNMMNEQKLKDLAAEFAKGIKTEDDLNQFTRLLTELVSISKINIIQLIRNNKKWEP